MTRLLAVTLMMMLSLALTAEETSTAFVEGTQYERIPGGGRTADPERIEVVEVFWYGCPHCFDFEPLLEKWQASLGPDVDFQRSPAMWNKVMALHAQAFYAARALGVLDRLHHPLFEALNVEGKRLETEDELVAWFATHGVKEADFRKAFDSFGVQASVKQADARARSYKITGTPEMVVNGKYHTSARMAGSNEAMLDVVDFLIAKERADRAGS